MRRVADDAGLNRVAWDLRMDPPPSPAPAPGAPRTGAAAAPAPDTSLAALRARRAANADASARGADDEESYFRVPGAAVLPGTYTATLTVGGQKYSKPVQVELDPRSDMTSEQLVAQSDASARMTVLTDRVGRLTATIDDVSQQLVRLQEQLRRSGRDSAAQGDGGASVAAPAVLGDIDATIKDLRHFRDSVVARPLAGLGYRQYPRLREEVQTVSGMIARPMMPPTAGEMLRLGELQTEVDQAQARLDGILQGRVARINQALAGTPHVITAPVRRTLIP
jgi:hypothetical protein